MNAIKSFLMVLLVAIGILSAAIYTSCNKSNCAGIVCQNGGTCNGGSCTCPSGFSGTFCDKVASGAISYRNSTFTPVNIFINGESAIIPPGGVAVFTGAFGSVASGNASTSASAPLGVSGAGGSIGSVINWQLNATFPAKDTLKDTLNVGATYFFLRLANNSNYNIINYTVNNGFLHGMAYEDVTIPNNGQYYDLGYYLAYSNSNLQTEYSNSVLYSLGISLPFTSNQLFEATINF